MAVRRIDGQHIHFFAGHFLRALQEIAGRADGRADSQAALLVLGGVGEFEFFLDVFYGDQALEVEILVHDQKLFDAVRLQNALGFFERGADRHGDQVVLGHDVADRLIEVALEAQVAVRQDARRGACPRVTGSPETLYLFMMSSAWRTDISGRDGDGIDDHSAFRALHPVHFLGLALDGHVAMNEPDAALARDGDGQARIGHGVHGGGHDREYSARSCAKGRCACLPAPAAPRIFPGSSSTSSNVSPSGIGPSIILSPDFSD